MSVSTYVPKVFVGPRPVTRLQDAVRRGGGQVVDLPSAEAIVYFGSDDPQELRSMIHPGIRWVQLPHAGIEPWNDAGLIADYPMFTCASGSYGSAVAEHALMLMLGAARRIAVHARATHWGENNTELFAGSTVALIGVGGIGTSLINLLQPFDVTILAVSDSGNVPGATRTVTRLAYRHVLTEADYVVLAAPSTPQTRGLIGGRELAMMKPTAWLINVARGDLVVTDDLVQALTTDAIGGAGLDVTDPEPLPAGHMLWTLPNVLITPHCANPQPSYWAGLADRVRENVARFAESGPLAAPPLTGVVRPERGY